MALRDNYSITTIDFGNNQIGNIGAIAIADVLKINRPIAKMLLDHNKLREEATIAITHSLNDNDFIIELDIQIWSRQPSLIIDGMWGGGPEDTYTNLQTDDFLSKNQLIFKTNLKMLETLHSADLQGLKQFFSSLSYKTLYIFSKQVLSLPNQEEGKEYHKLVKRGFIQKLFHVRHEA